MNSLEGSQDQIDIWSARDLDEVLYVAKTKGERIGEVTLKQTPRGVWEDRRLAWESLRQEQLGLLETRHRESLFDYSDRAHQDITHHLIESRADISDSVTRTIRDLRECFCLLKPITEVRTIYRGVPLYKDPNPHEPKQHFLSCTWNPYRAINFANNKDSFVWGEGRVLLEISLAKGSRVCAFEGKYPEGEYLLRPEVRWEVIDDCHSHGGRLIRLKCMPRAELEHGGN